MSEDDITTIQLTKGTRERLLGIGNKSETYDEVINRLIDLYEKKEAKK